MVFKPLAILNQQINFRTARCLTAALVGRTPGCWPPLVTPHSSLQIDQKRCCHLSRASAPAKGLFDELADRPRPRRDRALMRPPLVDLSC